MGQALYRKYRSKNLAEIVGQEHITSTLSNALKQGSISHAYLFTGPRGVGKTSIARILAYEVNGLPYDESANHLDIIEIDAASNRRIDEIRELRDKVHSAPANAKYKVYIIDEVHMLTKEAFNALLKTLEEPPEHAIFILATTEAHKVPETIISRTQRYTFKPIESGQVVEHLKSIAKKEKIKVDDQALQLIAEHGGGSFRDSISLLDQVSTSADKITLQDVQRVLGIAPEEAIADVLNSIQSGDPGQLVTKLAKLRQGGYQAPQIARQLSEKLREQLLEGSGSLGGQELTHLLQQLLAVPASHNPMSLLELVLLDSALKHSGGYAPAIKNETVSREPKPEAKPEVRKTPQPEAAEDQIPQAEEVVVSSSTGEFDNNAWHQVLQAIKHKHNTLYGIARMAVPVFAGDELILKFAFPFHQKRINDDRNRRVISDIIRKQTGQTITIRCEVDKDARVIPEPAVEIEKQVVDPLDTISNIFGSAEVIES